MGEDAGEEWEVNAGLGFTAKRGMVILRGYGFKAACVAPAWE